MPEERQRHIQLVRQLMCKDYHGMYREAMPYPFLVPGSEQYADTLCRTALIPLRTASGAEGFLDVAPGLSVLPFLPSQVGSEVDVPAW